MFGNFSLLLKTSGVGKGGRITRRKKSNKTWKERIKNDYADAVKIKRNFNKRIKKIREGKKCQSDREYYRGGEYEIGDGLASLLFHSLIGAEGSLCFGATRKRVCSLFTLSCQSLASLSLCISERRSGLKLWVGDFDMFLLKKCVDIGERCHSTLLKYLPVVIISFRKFKTYMLFQSYW